MEGQHNGMMCVVCCELREEGGGNEERRGRFAIYFPTVFVCFYIRLFNTGKILL